MDITGWFSLSVYVVLEFGGAYDFSFGIVGFGGMRFADADATYVVPG